VALKRESLLSYAAVSEEELLECPGVFEQDNTWTGVPVTTILEQVLRRRRTKSEGFGGVFEANLTGKIDFEAGEVVGRFLFD